MRGINFEHWIFRTSQVQLHFFMCTSELVAATCCQPLQNHHQQPVSTSSGVDDGVGRENIWKGTSMGGYSFYYHWSVFMLDNFQRHHWRVDY